MAEIQTAGRNGRAATLRVDLTPMVDLGFLLITFFIMTTTMSKPKAMDIQMPFSPSESTTAFYESSAITLLPAKDHRIFYYEGLFRADIGLKVVKNETALRQVLLNKQRSIRQRVKPEERELQVLIKSHNTATVDDIVGLFDEMAILKVNYVAMVDIYPEEVEKVDASIR